MAAWAMDVLQIQSALGVVAFPALLWVFSLEKRAFPIRQGVWTLGMQLVVAAVLLKTPPGSWFFKFCDGLSDGFTVIVVHAAQTVFGPLAEGRGGAEKRSQWDRKEKEYALGGRPQPET